MAENYGEKKETNEQQENQENKENQEKNSELPNHFVSRYEMKKEAMKYESGEDNRYKYETDKQGRIKHCNGELKLYPDNERNNYAQRKAGGEDRHKGEVEGEGKDDGGHLIGRRFGGSAELDNIVAQDSKLNRGEYKKMENKWEEYLSEKTDDGEQKYKVEVDIRCKYNEVKESTGQKDSNRPTEIYVYSKVTDRETGEVVEKQIYRFKNEPGQETRTRDMKPKEED